MSQNLNAKIFKKIKNSTWGKYSIFSFLSISLTSVVTAIVLQLIYLVSCHLSAKLNVNLLKSCNLLKNISLSQMEILTVVLYKNSKLYWSSRIYFISRYFLLCHDLVDHLADKMYRDAGAVT